MYYYYFSTDETKTKNKQREPLLLLRVDAVLLDASAASVRAQLGQAVTLFVFRERVVVATRDVVDRSTWQEVFVASSNVLFVQPTLAARDALAQVVRNARYIIFLTVFHFCVSSINLIFKSLSSSILALALLLKSAAATGDDCTSQQLDDACQRLLQTNALIGDDATLELAAPYGVAIASGLPSAADTQPSAVRSNNWFFVFVCVVASTTQ